MDVAANLAEVRGKIDAKVEECNRPKGSVKLVAVSKTKPMELLMDAYNVSLRFSWFWLAHCYCGDSSLTMVAHQLTEVIIYHTWHILGFSPIKLLSITFTKYIHPGRTTRLW